MIAQFASRSGPTWPHTLVRKYHSGLGVQCQPFPERASRFLSFSVLAAPRRYVSLPSIKLAGQIDCVVSAGWARMLSTGCAGEWGSGRTFAILWNYFVSALLMSRGAIAQVTGVEWLQDLTYLIAAVI